MWIQRASAFSSSVFVATCVAFSKQVEVEESCNKEPQPLVALSVSRNVAAFSKQVEVEKSRNKEPQP